MKTVDLVAIGDPHLDKLSTLFRHEHLSLQIGEIEKALQYAIDNGIPYAVILGDVAHRHRLSEEAAIALFQMLDKYDGRLIIWIILGNHDYHSEGLHSLQLFIEMYRAQKFKSVHILDKPQQTVIHGVPLNFLPYPYYTPIESEECGGTVNFAHAEIAGAKRDNGSRIKEGIPITEGDVYVLGHLHTAQRRRNAYFAGTMFQTNFGEKGNKYFLHCRFRNRKGRLEHKIEYVRNHPKFRLINLNVQTKRDLKRVKDDPYRLYKLVIHKGVRISEEWLAAHPNVINHAIYRNRKELELLVRATDELFNESTDSSLEYSLTDNLPNYLKTEFKADDETIKRANVLVQGLIKDLRIKESSADTELNFAEKAA